MDFFMKPTNWWWNPTKFHKKKTPKRGKEKATRGKDQTKQVNNPKEASHMEVKEPLNTKTSTSHLKHIH
jgi:hypothetical protein